MENIDDILNNIVNDVSAIRNEYPRLKKGVKISGRTINVKISHISKSIQQLRKIINEERKNIPKKSHKTQKGGDIPPEKLAEIRKQMKDEIMQEIESSKETKPKNIEITKIPIGMAKNDEKTIQIQGLTLETEDIKHTMDLPKEIEKIFGGNTPEINGQTAGVKKKVILRRKLNTKKHHDTSSEEETWFLS